MKYEVPPAIATMYAFNKTGFHYRVRDPDTSSRENMELCTEPKALRDNNTSPTQ